ncbi:MAG: VCBS repeat-containing protein [Pseudomonadota bacterium]
MSAGAPRLLCRLWRPIARGALLALGPWLSLAAPAAADLWKSDPLTAARYAEPTGRYPHGVLGDAIEYGALELVYGSGQAALTIRLPENRVFEDVAPRMIDVDRDGRDEAVVVESDQRLGARLAIYNGGGLIAATPFIGTRFRWLAPLGAADLDGDGAIELAYIDRPHLAKTLRVWRFEGGNLTEVGSLGGLTNHRIGEADIAGGIRDCGAGPEMILATANWAELVAVTFDGAEFATRTIDDGTTRPQFAEAMACAN